MIEGKSGTNNIASYSNLKVPKFMTGGRLQAGNNIIDLKNPSRKSGTKVQNVSCEQTVQVI